MQIASFGGLLKDFRVRKGITQHDIAYAMGWSEPSRLSRIEQGITRKPNRETVDRLSILLKLTRIENGQLLLAGGYLPDEEEILRIREETAPMLESWDYPAYLLDFAWRLLAWNGKAADLYELRGDIASYVLKTHPCSLELVFNPEFPPNKFLKDTEQEMWHNLLKEKLVRFKLLHQQSTSEKWYQELFRKMMRNTLFSRMWQDVQLDAREVGIANYEHKLLVNPKDHKKRLDFHILKSPLLQDVRFEMNYHIPGNEDTLGEYRR